MRHRRDISQLDFRKSPIVNPIELTTIATAEAGGGIAKPICRFRIDKGFKSKTSAAGGWKNLATAAKTSENGAQEGSGISKIFLGLPLRETA